MIGPDDALALARFLRFAALLWLWGAYAYLAALVPAALAQDVARRLRGAALTSAGVCIGATLMMLPLQSAAVGDGWRDAVHGDTVAAVLFQTSIGTAWWIQLAAAVVLAGACFPPRRPRLGALAVAAGLGLAASTFSGHAVMDAGMARVVHQGNDALHLLAGGAWFGALVPLWMILGRLGAALPHRDESTALRRYSTAGHLAVAFVLATGVVNDLFIVGGWPTDWRMPYQTLLSAKIALVGLMTVLALVNRYHFVPRLALDRSATLRRLRTVTLAEIGLGIAVVALVSALGLLEPVQPPDGTGAAGAGVISN